MEARINFFIDKYHPKQNGKCKVKLEVYFNRKRKHYPIELELTPEEFNSVMFSKRRNTAQKEIYTKLTAFKAKADTILETLPVFTYDSFEKAFYTDRDTHSDIIQAFNNKVSELKDEGRIGTAITYEYALKSLLDYKEKITFADITPSLLKKYEKSMLDSGKSKTTIGMYLRNLRAIYNQQNISSSLYPFGRGKYEIPNGKNIKKALNMSDIVKIFKYKATTKAEEKARDIWTFLYLCNGMNVKDFCLLRWENLRGDILYYQRAKTANTKEDEDPIEIHLKPQSKAVISKYGSPSINGKGFIFPYLNSKMTAEDQRKVHQQLTKTINKYMERISEKLELDQKVTTYTARHSFATILQRSGSDISMISNLLGHSKISVTESYLAGFESEVVKGKTDALIKGL